MEPIVYVFNKLKLGYDLKNQISEIELKAYIASIWFYRLYYKKFCSWFL